MLKRQIYTVKKAFVDVGKPEVTVESTSVFPSQAEQMGVLLAKSVPSTDSQNKAKYRLNSWKANFG